HLAELLIGLLVILVVSVGDLRGAVGFSSFTVLGYYAIANVCAWRQPPQERRFPRWLAPVGVLGCLLLAFALPAGTVIAGLTVFVAGALVWFLRSKFVSG
ncbi:MAG TPA: amino acid permease, partial [Acidimicrobiia bacterium]|nr:amino acid permease [Acidimicrobiia bacterium]